MPGTLTAADTTAYRHPISRWYLMPAARAAVDLLGGLRFNGRTIRPTHVTLAGLCFAGMAVGLLFWLPQTTSAAAAAFVLAAWFCDRVDGLLARRLGVATAWGGWLDANVDELVDVALQTAVAAAAANLTGSRLPWLFFAAFLAGKYLFMFGLASEQASAERPSNAFDTHGMPGRDIQATDDRNGMGRQLRRLYHLPGNADVRTHLLVLALLSGWLTAELAIVAVYYNLRWVVRYRLVARRLGGVS